VQDTLRNAAARSTLNIVANTPHQQFDIANSPSPGECCAVERQFKRADIDAIPGDKRASTAQSCAVDICAVVAAQVSQHYGSVHHLKGRVTA
jgi:hypothetical protein